MITKKALGGLAAFAVALVAASLPFARGASEVQTGTSNGATAVERPRVSIVGGPTVAAGDHILGVALATHADSKVSRIVVEAQLGATSTLSAIITPHLDGIAQIGSRVTIPLNGGTALTGGRFYGGAEAFQFTLAGTRYVTEAGVQSTVKYHESVQFTLGTTSAVQRFTVTEIYGGGGVARAGGGGGTFGASSLDAIGTTQGSVLYRNASTWTTLSPGTSGQFLTTGGAGANPSWTTSTNYWQRSGTTISPATANDHVATLSDTGQLKFGAASDVGLKYSATNTLKVTDGGAGGGKLRLGGGANGIYFEQAAVPDEIASFFGQIDLSADVRVNSGFLIFNPDNTKDIGASGATRPRTVYAGTSVVTPAVTAPAALTLSSTGANNVAVNTNGSTRFMVDSGGGAHFYGTASTSGASEIITDFLTTGLSETTGARHLVKGTDAATNGGWRITTFRSDSTNERNPVWVRPAGGLEFTAYSTESCIFSTGGSERWRMTAAGALEGRSAASQLAWTTGLGAITHVLFPSDQPGTLATQNNQNLVLAPNGSGSVVVTTNALRGTTDGTTDLGSSTIGFKRLYVDATIDTTAGDSATIDKASGRFRKDTTGTTFTLTSNKITANSIVFLTPANAAIDATATTWTVSASAGSATITFNAAPTGNFDMNFFVVNND